MGLPARLTACTHITCTSGPGSAQARALTASPCKSNHHLPPTHPSLPHPQCYNQVVQHTASHLPPLSYLVPQCYSQLLNVWDVERRTRLMYERHGGPPPAADQACLPAKRVLRSPTDIGLVVRDLGQDVHRGLLVREMRVVCVVCGWGGGQ